jgi:signal transduction histidine kinase
MRSEIELVGGLVGDSVALLDGGPAALAEARRHLEEARSETDAATSEVDFMTRLVQDLLLLARDTSDKLAHSWSALDIPALTADVVARMRPIAEKDGLALTVVDTLPGDSGPLWVRGDAGLLRQLLYGLLENAVRYTPSGGSITVTIREDGRGHLLGDHRRRAVVEVRDTGIGIAPQHLGSIFEPFYRAVSTTRPLHGEQHGTGLGLAMAQWIVRAHRGTIGVRSEVGKGSAFTVELPLAHPDDTPMVVEQ